MAKQHHPHHNCTIRNEQTWQDRPVHLYKGYGVRHGTQLQTAVSLYNMMNMIREAQGEPRRVYQTAQGLADQQSPLARTWQASRRTPPSHPADLLFSGH
jgi:hypothetical protein